MSKGQPIISPQFPLVEPDLDPYPFLAAGLFTEEEMEHMCIQTAKVKSIPKLNTHLINVVYKKRTYYEVPILIHTDIGTREPQAKEALETEPVDRFKNAAHMFLMDGNIAIKMHDPVVGFERTFWTRDPMVSILVYNNPETEKEEVLGVVGINDNMFPEFYINNFGDSDYGWSTIRLLLHCDIIFQWVRYEYDISGFLQPYKVEDSELHSEFIYDVINDRIFYIPNTTGTKRILAEKLQYASSSLDVDNFNYYTKYNCAKLIGLDQFNWSLPAFQWYAATYTYGAYRDLEGIRQDPSFKRVGDNMISVWSEVNASHIIDYHPPITTTTNDMPKWAGGVNYNYSFHAHITGPNIIIDRYLSIYTKHISHSAYPLKWDHTNSIENKFGMHWEIREGLSKPDEIVVMWDDETQDLYFDKAKYSRRSGDWHWDIYIYYQELDITSSGYRAGIPAYNIPYSPNFLTGFYGVGTTGAHQLINRVQSYVCSDGTDRYDAADCGNIIGSATQTKLDSVTFNPIYSNDFGNPLIKHKQITDFIKMKMAEGRDYIKDHRDTDCVISHLKKCQLLAVPYRIADEALRIEE